VILLLKQKVMTLLSSFLVGLMLIASGTSALFTSEDSNDNPFKSGTVILELSNYDDVTNHYFNVGNMAPGDTEEREITVTNKGTLDLRFDITHEWDVTGGNLGDALSVSYFMHDGASWKLVKKPNNANIVLPKGASKKILVKVHLPLTTDNTYQGETGLLNIMAYAEQTKNNPIVTHTWGDHTITVDDGGRADDTFNNFNVAYTLFDTVTDVRLIDFEGIGWCGSYGHQHSDGNHDATFDIQVRDADTGNWIVIWSNNGVISKQYIENLGALELPSIMNIDGLKFRGDKINQAWHSMGSLKYSMQR
jgi:predicted ribosomally synthesized peptide with SipW-like signal peptide